MFEATAVITFKLELSPDLDDAVASARYFLEEELGFDTRRVLCVEQGATPRRCEKGPRSGNAKQRRLSRLRARNRQPDAV